MKILALGSNGSGQLGLGHAEDVSEPTECLFYPPSTTNPATNPEIKTGTATGKAAGILEGRGVKRIACGGNHTLILFDDGAVYAAGLGFEHNEQGGDHGHGDDDDGEHKFKRVMLRRTTGAREEVIDRFRDVCATWSASLFVANTAGDEEVVIALGTGDKGELGLGASRTVTSASSSSGGYIIIDDSSIIQDFPPAGTRIECIGSSAYHVVAVLSSGEVYGWGAARKGQLGGGNSSRKVVWEPVRIRIGVDGFVPGCVACGREFTFVSGLVGEEYGYTILGGEKWGIVSGPPSLQTLRKPGGRYSVSASWHGIYLHDGLDNSGLAWGRNDRGQLGPLSLSPSTSTNQQPIRSDGVSQFVAGSEHAVALALDGRTVLACGWGEHGNCGSSTDEHGDVKGRVSQLRLPDEILQNDKAKVVRLAAGCATTWIVTS
jgi:protein ATS1